MKENRIRDNVIKILFQIYSETWKIFNPIDCVTLLKPDVKIFSSIKIPFYALDLINFGKIK
jgi:predicted nucleotidyltransferase